MEGAPKVKSTLEKLESLMRDPKFRTDGANVCNLAYHLDNGGKEEDYKPIDAENKRDIGVNMAAFHAVKAGVESVLAFAADQDPVHDNEENFLGVLSKVVDGTMNPGMAKTFRIIANATWNQTKEMIDGGAQQGRVNVYGVLEKTKNASEIEKDMVQIKAAAKFLLEKLS